ncbi:MAG: hypothetical protein WC277_07435 [Bacilli bacterium]
MTTTDTHFADRSALLAVAERRARRYRTETLPVCGLTVRIQSLNEGELSAYYAKTAMAKSDAARETRVKNATRRLFALCLVDGDGNRLLTDADTEALAGLDARDSQMLASACQEHVGVTKGEIEDLVKNSEETADGDSRTDSPDSGDTST